MAPDELLLPAVPVLISWSPVAPLPLSAARLQHQSLAWIYSQFQLPIQHFGSGTSLPLEHLPTLTQALVRSVSFVMFLHNFLEVVPLRTVVQFRYHESSPLVLGQLAVFPLGSHEVCHPRQFCLSASLLVPLPTPTQAFPLPIPSLNRFAQVPHKLPVFIQFPKSTQALQNL